MSVFTCPELAQRGSDHKQTGSGDAVAPQPLGLCQAQGTRRWHRWSGRSRHPVNDPCRSHTHRATREWSANPPKRSCTGSFPGPGPSDPGLVVHTGCTGGDLAIAILPPENPWDSATSANPPGTLWFEWRACRCERYAVPNTTPPPRLSAVVGEFRVVVSTTVAMQAVADSEFETILGASSAR